MAIAPIDLQTLFAQIDKVGKNQAASKEGQTLHQAIQGAHIQKKTEEQILQVNEAQNTGEGAEKVNEHGHGQQEGKQGERKSKREEEEEEEFAQAQAAFFHDPTLGNKIDISL
jgi:hypothetical protein